LDIWKFNEVVAGKLGIKIRYFKPIGPVATMGLWWHL